MHQPNTRSRLSDAIENLSSKSESSVIENADNLILPLPLTPQLAASDALLQGDGLLLNTAPLLAAPKLMTTLYRTYGYRHAKSGNWRIVVQGRRCYDVPTQLNLTKRLMLRGLIKRLQLPAELVDNPNFQGRVAGFLVNAEPGHKIKVELVDQIHSIRRRTRKSGTFSGRINIAAGAFANHEVFGRQKREGLAPVIQTYDQHEPARTELFLADTFGINVVTDIDDTVKQTEVTSRQRMLQRTFLDPFEPIVGMAELYRSWAEQFPILFQYVSSSPWQLYQPLQTFLDEFRYPLGSIHLQWFTIREELLKKWRLSRRRGKEAVIRTLIKRMPHRRFLLVGDSGERDPEIYANLAEKFPRSILGVAIRQLDSRPLEKQRLKQVSDRLNSVPLRLFREPTEISDLVEEWYRT